MKEHKKVYQKEMSKVTLLLVLGHLSSKQTGTFEFETSDYEKFFSGEAKEKKLLKLYIRSKRHPCLALIKATNKTSLNRIDMALSQL